MIGTNAGDPRERLAALVSALTGESSGCSTLDGARAQLQAALAGRQLLLVIDDVWNEAHIQALLDASTGCARLITTRKPATLPYGAQASDVHTMNEADAVRLLGAGAGNRPGSGRLSLLRRPRHCCRPAATENMTMSISLGSFQALP